MTLLFARYGRWSMVIAVFLCAMVTHAAPIITADSGLGVTTDRFDISQGTVVTSSTNTIAGFPIQTLFGATGASGESGDRTIFSDSNGSAGFKDVVTFQTPGWINLSSYELRLAQDGTTSARSASSVQLYASADNITFTKISDTTATTPNLSNYNTNYGSSEIKIADNTAAAGVRFFELDVTRATGAGPRAIELDGFGTNSSFSGTYLDRVLLNNTTNGIGDQPAGHVNSVVASSALAGDDPKEAFGKSTGPVENGTFLFADTGHPTTGNTLTFTTDIPVTLAGLEIIAGAGGPPGDPRRIGGITVFADTNGNGLFDEPAVYSSLSATQGINDVLFNSIVTASKFEVSFAGIDNAGPRVTEIDALAFVPEPASMVLFGFGAIGLVAVARRRKA